MLAQVELVELVHEEKDRFRLAERALAIGEARGQTLEGEGRVRVEACEEVLEAPVSTVDDVTDRDRPPAGQQLLLGRADDGRQPGHAAVVRL